MNLTHQENTARECFTRAFSLSEQSLRLIHRGESIVFEASRNGQPLILKVTVSDQDMTGQLDAQLQWMHALHTSGLVVPEPKVSLTNEANDFFIALIRGYRRQADFLPEWPAMFPALLKLRELSLYHSFYSQVDLTRPEPDELSGYLFHSIRDNRPFLDLDFGALARDYLETDPK